MNADNLLTYPLTGNDMLLLNPDAKLITYDQLNNVFDIMELFRDTKKVIILILLFSRHSGHWVTLFINKEGLNYYDDYGKAPDYELRDLSINERIEYNEKTDRLKFLLNKYPYIYNGKKLQRAGTLTCGCFVSHRLHYSFLTEDEYVAELLKVSKGDPDFYVAKYCLNLLNKKNM